MLSTRPVARIKSVDPSAALAMEGVIDYVSAKDIPGECHIEIATNLQVDNWNVFVQVATTLELLHTTKKFLRPSLFIMLAKCSD